MAKGLSSDLVFRVVVKGCPYVLLIIMRVNEQTDPRRQFTCLQAAEEAGLTPRVWYASIEDGISITDFVEPTAFSIMEALVRIPATLQRLHSLPPFPKEFNYVTAHNGFIWRFRGTGLLSKDQIEEVLPRYEQLCAIYPRLDSDMVSCHMDLKPENIPFRRTMRLAGELASRIPERPLLRSGHCCELRGHERRRREEVS
jgi:hypothetical protein